MFCAHMLPASKEKPASRQILFFTFMLFIVLINRFILSIAMCKNKRYFTIRLIRFYLILGELSSDKKYSFRKADQNLYKNKNFLYKFSKNLSRFFRADGSVFCWLCRYLYNERMRKLCLPFGRTFGRHFLNYCFISYLCTWRKKCYGKTDE